jgi:hypothetical protein
MMASSHAHSFVASISAFVGLVASLGTGCVAALLKWGQHGLSEMHGKSGPVAAIFCEVWDCGRDCWEGHDDFAMLLGQGP